KRTGTRHATDNRSYLTRTRRVARHEDRGREESISISSARRRVQIPTGAGQLDSRVGDCEAVLVRDAHEDSPPSALLDRPGVDGNAHKDGSRWTTDPIPGHRDRGSGTGSQRSDVARPSSRSLPTGRALVALEGGPGGPVVVRACLDQCAGHEEHPEDREGPRADSPRATASRAVR